MTTTTKRRFARTVEIIAPVAMSGEEFLQSAIDTLGVWGGMSHSIMRTDDLEVSIGIDPDHVQGGVAAIIEWLDSLDVEYSADVRRFSMDDD